MIYQNETIMKTVTLTYGGFTKSNKEIYFVIGSSGNAIGQCLASNLCSVKDKLESKGYKVIVN